MESSRAYLRALCPNLARAKGICRLSECSLLHSSSLLLTPWDELRSIATRAATAPAETKRKLPHTGHLLDCVNMQHAWVCRPAMDSRTANPTWSVRSKRVLAVLLLVQPRVRLISSAAIRCSWLTVTLLATRTARSFLADLLSTWLLPASTGAQGYSPWGRALHFSCLTSWHSCWTTS